MNIILQTLIFTLGHFLLGFVAIVIFVGVVMNQGNSFNSDDYFIFLLCLTVVAIATFTSGVGFFVGVCFKDIYVKYRLVFISGVIIGIVSFIASLVIMKTLGTTGFPQHVINYLSWFFLGTSTPIMLEKLNIWLTQRSTGPPKVSGVEH